MLPKTLEGWLFLIFACLGGFLIGQWIRHRRKKSEEKHTPIMRLPASSRLEKRTSKKARRKAARQLSK